jgi:hypothetical protein
MPLQATQARAALLKNSFLFMCRVASYSAYQIIQELSEESTIFMTGKATASQTAEARGCEK